jgi:translation initiation factor IF-2
MYAQNRTGTYLVMSSNPKSSRVSGKQVTCNGHRTVLTLSRRPIATVLVLRGSLKPGSHILSGVHHAKVRIMHDSSGKVVKSASPGMAVTVSGWKSLPDAGDEVLQGTESEIKRAIVNRRRKADTEASLADVEAINTSRQQERDRRQAELEVEAAGVDTVKPPKEEEPTGPKELRLLIKADVSGSAEAVEGALQGIGNHLAMTKVISSSVGAIMESDVMMAKTVGGQKRTSFYRLRRGTDCLSF